jgi:hypothetical protein
VRRGVTSIEVAALILFSRNDPQLFIQRFLGSLSSKMSEKSFLQRSIFKPTWVLLGVIQ